MVAAIEPPKMMIIACSEMNMWRSPPSSIIVAMTIMPATSPTLVMISMGNSNANATTAVLAGWRGPTPNRIGNPRVPPLKTRKG